MDIFDELIECEVAVVVPHLKLVLEFCMKVSILFLNFMSSNQYLH